MLVDQIFSLRLDCLSTANSSKSKRYPRGLNGEVICHHWPSVKEKALSQVPAFERLFASSAHAFFKVELQMQTTLVSTELTPPKRFL